MKNWQVFKSKLGRADTGIMKAILLFLLLAGCYYKSSVDSQRDDLQNNPFFKAKYDTYEDVDKTEGSKSARDVTYDKNQLARAKARLASNESQIKGLENRIRSLNTQYSNSDTLQTEIKSINNQIKNLYVEQTAIKEEIKRLGG